MDPGLEELYGVATIQKSKQIAPATRFLIYPGKLDCEFPEN